MAGSFDVRAVEREIVRTGFSGSIVHLATVGSTNDLALAAAQAGAGCGVWIADEQTAGRGRGAHTWHSAAGDGLYMTALVTPPVPMQSSLRLSFATAIAVQAAIAAVTGMRVREEIDIRWPNDLTVPQREGRSRKVGGILIETAAHPAGDSVEAMLRYAVIGIGVNCNHRSFPPELDAVATSLRRELAGHPLVAREPLAAAILIALDEEIRRMVRSARGADNRVDNCPDHRPARRLSDFSSWLTGKRVRVEPADGAPGYTGVTAGLDASGFLRVAADGGELRTVLSGGLREP